MGHPEVLQGNLSCYEEICFFLMMLSHGSKGLQGRCQENKDKSELLVSSECVFKERGTKEKNEVSIQLKYHVKTHSPVRCNI